MNVDQQILDKLRRSPLRRSSVARQIRTVGLVETLLRLHRLVRSGRQADFNVNLKREVGVSKRVGRLHSVAFKARLALGALREDKAMAPLFHEFNLYVNQITNAQPQLLECAADVFGAYASVADARTSIGRHIDRYNTQRPYASLHDKTTRRAYRASLPKSALAASYEIRWRASYSPSLQLVRRKCRTPQWSTPHCFEHLELHLSDRGYSYKPSYLSITAHTGDFTEAPTTEVCHAWNRNLY